MRRHTSLRALNIVRLVCTCVKCVAHVESRPETHTHMCTWLSVFIVQTSPHTLTAHCTPHLCVLIIVCAHHCMFTSLKAMYSFCCANIAAHADCTLYAALVCAHHCTCTSLCVHITVCAHHCMCTSLNVHTTVCAYVHTTECTHRCMCTSLYVHITICTHHCMCA